jgi:hypothetical protein
MKKSQKMPQAAGKKSAEGVDVFAAGAVGAGGFWSWRGFFYGFLLGVPWLLQREFTRFLLNIGYFALVVWYEIWAGPNLESGDHRIINILAIISPFVMGLINGESFFAARVKPKSRAVAWVCVVLSVFTFFSTPKGQQQASPVISWAETNLVTPASTWIGFTEDTSWRELTFSWDEKTKYWGFKNPEGKWVIEPKYFVTPLYGGFKRGRALVGSAGKYDPKKPNTMFFINAKDERVGPYFRSFNGRLRGGDLACVDITTPRSNVAYGVVNVQSGAWIVEPDDKSRVNIECLYHKQKNRILVGHDLRGYLYGIQKSKRVRVYGAGDTPVIDKKTEKFIILGEGYAVATKTLQNYKYCARYKNGSRRNLPNRLYHMEIYDRDGKLIRTAQAEALNSRNQKCNRNTPGFSPTASQ